MGEISLEMIWKRLEDMQAELRALRGDTEHGFAALTKSVGAMAQTLVGVQHDIRLLQRDVRSMDNRIATLEVATAAHTTRLDHIEDRLGIERPDLFPPA